MRSISVSPVMSNRQSSTLVAWAEKSAKLTPRPSQVAPSGFGRPSRIRVVVFGVVGKGSSFKGQFCNECRRASFPRRTRFRGHFAGAAMLLVCPRNPAEQHGLAAPSVVGTFVPEQVDGHADELEMGSCRRGGA